MRAKKTKCLQRVVALILVCASLLSHLTVGVYAEPTTEPVVEPTVEPMQSVEEQAAEPVLSTYEKLLAAVTVDEFYALLYEQGYIYDLETMTAAELAALDARADQLYDPAQDDAELYEMIKDGIGSFSGAYEDNDVAVLADETITGAVSKNSVEITEDTVWELAGGTLTLKGRININAGATLTIIGHGEIVADTKVGIFDMFGLQKEGACLVVEGDGGKDSIVLDGKGNVWSGIYAKDGVSTTVSIENVTVTNCTEGAIYVQSGAETTVTATNCAITGCTGLAAIYVNYKDGNAGAQVDLTISNTTISKCSGGAIQIGKNATFDLEIYDSEISSCSAYTGAGVNFADSVKGVASITRTRFVGNRTSQGGVIRTTGSSGVTLTLEQCLFKENIADSDLDKDKIASYTNGAAIYWNACGKDLYGDTAAVTITDCQFIGNTVEFSGSSLEDGHGGAIYNEAFMTIGSKFASDFTQEEKDPGSIRGNLIQGNMATNYGGGIMVPTYNGGEDAHNGKGATLVLDESVFIIENSATRGGGIAMSVGKGTVGDENPQDVAYELTCAGATIQNNTASEMGGGVYLEREKDKDYYDSTVNLTAGTISGNTAPKGGAICVYNASETTSGHTNEVNIGSDIGALNIENNGPADEEVMAGSIGGAIYSYYGNVNMVSGALRYNKAENGGAIYVEGGDMAISGGLLSENTAAANGGGIYVNGGNVDISGGEVNSNTAAANGGAIYVEGGDMAISGGLLSENTAAVNGGGIYVTGGTVDISGGTVSSNTAAADGGGIYVNGGDIAISDGTVSGNTAAENGGGIAVNNGQIIMSGGTVSDNKAQTGSGGGMYVSAPAGQPVTVKVFSGTLSGNTAATSGGAVGVNGLADSEILVQIGVNENHFTGEDIVHEESGDRYTHADCPLFKDNHAVESGGAFYINADDGSTTKLNIYCSVDEGNSVEQDIDPLQNNKQLSSYLMVQGGEVVISTSENNELEDDGYTDAGDDQHGNMQVNGTIHVVGGKLTIFGSMENPAFKDYLTTDLEKEGDAFNDYRESAAMVKISYHENFWDAAGNPDATQTAFDIESGAVHQIETGLYAHDGYELIGWNTKADASGDWYLAGSTYRFYNPGDPDERTDEYIEILELTLYAIWKVNGYTITFDAGVAAGETWWGSVDSISCNYVTKVKLPQNDPQKDQGFVYPGYVFAGWKLGEKTYQPGNEVSMLTDKNADVVTFVAQWTPCGHGDCSYVVSAGDTIKKTCNICQLSATAKLTAADAVYDAKSHPAMLECSNPAFWTPDISYTATKIGKSESVTESNCINAGNYTATITQDGKTVTATFTIHKAEQAAPTEVPTYVRPTGKTDGQYQLKINQISAEKRSADVPTQAGEGKPIAEYIVRYYEGVNTVDKVYKGNDLPDHLIHPLTTALTTYSVHVRYEETDNYNASAEVSAKAAFYFATNFVLDITVDSGISYSTNHTEAAAGANASLIITATLQDRYYLLNENNTDDDLFDLTIEGNGANHVQITRTQQGSPNKMQYTVVATKLGNGNYEAHLHIGTTKKAAAMEAIAKEKEHFNNFVGSNSVTIARDSAFTAQYKVTGYYDEDYAVPELTFSSALPAGTSVILRDRSDGSYWYYVCSSATESVKLYDAEAPTFRKMGVETDVPYPRDRLAVGDLTLQFVVDFSGADSPPAGNSLECTLRMANANANVQTVSATVAVQLEDVTYDLEAASSSGLEIELEIGAAASKYDRRDLALVLTPATGVTLPIDAEIKVKIGDSEATYRPKQNGMVIIPIGNAESMEKTVELVLASKMFPMEEKTYALNAALYLSASDAESAPLNGTVLASAAVSFTSVREETGIDVSTDDDRRIYTVGEEMTVSVAMKAVADPTAYTISVQVHEEQDGVYVNTALPCQNSGSEYTFELNVKRKGNYCVVATLSDAGGYVVAESRYYIIIKE